MSDDMSKPLTSSADPDARVNADTAPQGAGPASPVDGQPDETPKDPTGGQIPDDIFSPKEDAPAHVPPAAPQTPVSGSQFAAAPSKAPDGMPAAPAPSSPAVQKPAPAPSGKKKFSFKSGGLGSQSAPPAAPPAGTNHKNDASGKLAQGNIPRGALNAVVTRNEYYRDGYRSLMKIAMIEGMIIVALIVAFVFYMNIHDQRDRYFATTADGRILQLAPLDQPNITQAALMSWVSQAATETMTFGFHDYQRRLQDASRHFTRRGWESFTTALQRARIIESVENLQQVVTATPGGSPVLLQHGVFNNRYRWIVRLPLLVTYTSGNKTTSTNMNVTITIERVPTLESPNGVGIDSWIAV